MMEKNFDRLTLEFILVGLLQGKPLHGYALFEKLQETRELSLIWHVKRSKVYYLLEKLESQGLLESEIISHPSYPDRKTYSITREGQAQFSRWLAAPVRSGRNMRVVFLSRLFFALREGKSTADKLIEGQLRETRGWLDSLQGQLADLDDPDFITEQVFTFRIGQVQAMITWLENCQRKISDD